MAREKSRLEFIGNLPINIWASFQSAGNIFKSGDKSSVSNYQPVALLSTISKVFEKVVYKHIFNFLMENALIYKFQSGFLPGHSTTH
jgi:hypothetical protein